VRSLLLLLSVCPLVLVPASIGEARSGGTMTVRVLSVPSGFDVDDVGAKGLSAGDRFMVADRLYNLVPQFGKRKGALVGTDTGTTTVRAGSKSADFRGVAKLPGGTIVVRARLRVGVTLSSVTVVGGTGRFAGARGTVALQGMSRGRATNVFRLTLP
jgi:hypothetical protein